MNVGLSVLRRGLLAAVLIVPTMAAGAEAATPNVVLNSATSRVSYDLAIAPSEPETEAESGSGRQSNVGIAGAIASEDGAADADATQSTTVRHGPSTNGYTVRLIRSSAQLSGSTKLEDPAGGPVTADAVARSTATFTVNAPQFFAFENTRHVGTTKYDPNLDCSRASVVLMRGETVVFRQTSQTPEPGCDAPPADVGPAGGTLSAGVYTLTTLVETSSAARKEYGTDFTGTMAGDATTKLTLGGGPICRNVLPGSGGATIVGTTGRDVLCGGPGPDTLKGFGGGDTLLGAGGVDKVIGGPGADVIDGGPAGDTIFGNSGNDDINPAGGADTVYAGEHSDTVRGCDNVKDSLYGQAGADKVFRDSNDAIGGFETISVC